MFNLAKHPVQCRWTAVYYYNLNALRGEAGFITTIMTWYRSNIDDICSVALSPVSHASSVRSKKFYDCPMTPPTIHTPKQTFSKMRLAALVKTSGNGRINPCCHLFMAWADAIQRLHCLILFFFWGGACVCVLFLFLLMGILCWGDTVIASVSKSFPNTVQYLHVYTTGKISSSSLIWTHSWLGLPLHPRVLQNRAWQQRE